MLSSTVRRSLLSLLAVSTVGTLGFSAAASLDVTSDVLGAGDASVGACTAAQVTTEYTTTFESDLAPSTDPAFGFAVATVTLSAPTADCEGATVDIALLDEQATPVELWNSVDDHAAAVTFVDVDTTNSEAVFTLPGTGNPVPAELLGNISVVVDGP